LVHAFQNAGASSLINTLGARQPTTSLIFEKKKLMCTSSIFVLTQKAARYPSPNSSITTIVVKLKLY